MSNQNKQRKNLRTRSRFAMSMILIIMGGPLGIILGIGILLFAGIDNPSGLYTIIEPFVVVLVIVFFALILFFFSIS